jgi:hypothetical protein
LAENRACPKNRDFQKIAPLLFAAGFGKLLPIENIHGLPFI